MEELGPIYAAGKERFLEYCVLVDKNYDLNWHHKEIAVALEQAEQWIKGESSKIKIIILEVPPRMGKSTEASVLFPGWFLGRNPEREIITCSYSGELSTDFGGKTRDLQLLHPLSLPQHSTSLIMLAPCALTTCPRSSNQGTPECLS